MTKYLELQNGETPPLNPRPEKKKKRKKKKEREKEMLFFRTNL
jgi:hypothetical protein